MGSGAYDIGTVGTTGGCGGVGVVGTTGVTGVTGVDGICGKIVSVGVPPPDVIAPDTENILFTTGEHAVGHTGVTSTG